MRFKYVELEFDRPALFDVSSCTLGLGNSPHRLPNLRFSCQKDSEFLLSLQRDRDPLSVTIATSFE